MDDIDPSSKASRLWTKFGLARDTQPVHLNWFVPFRYPSAVEHIEIAHIMNEGGERTHTKWVNGTLSLSSTTKAQSRLDYLPGARLSRISSVCYDTNDNPGNKGPGGRQNRTGLSVCLRMGGQSVSVLHSQYGDSTMARCYAPVARQDRDLKVVGWVLTSHSHKHMEVRGGRRLRQDRQTISSSLLPTARV